MPQPLRRSFAATVLALAALLAGAFAAPVLGAAPTYKGTSADGEVAFFESDEQLVPGDTDTKRDIYARSFDASVGDDGAYVTRQVSIGPAGGNDAYNALFEDADTDGDLAFFSTEEPLLLTDTDRRSDVYVRDLELGTTRLLSRGLPGCQPGCGNGAFDAGFAGATAQGDRVFVVTLERLDPGADTDASVDVYERGLATDPTLVSTGSADCAPACGNGVLGAALRGVAANGSRAFFATSESLVASDQDGATDIYARDLPGGPTVLVSAGAPDCAPCGNDDDSPAIFTGSSGDGDKVFFSTTEGLVDADQDGANDVYQRAAGITTLVSGGSANQPASFVAAPGDGARVFFGTAESLVGSGDLNGANDIYVWQGGAPQLVTSGSCCGSTFGAVTADAEIVFFTTTQALAVPADADLSADVYAQEVGGGAPTLVSAGSSTCLPACGNGGSPARFNRASSSGDRVFFTSDEQLFSGAQGDFDNDDDIYARDLADAETTLETPPPGLCPTSACDAIFVDASAAADHVFFQTSERLVAEDVDSETDIYERGPNALLSGALTRLVSTGNDPGLDLGPPPPVLLGTNPTSPGASTEPAILGTAEGDSAIKVYPTSSCSGEPVATGSAEQLAGTGIKVSVPAGATRAFWATAEAEGFTSLCSSPVTYKQETASVPAPTDGAGGGPGKEPAGGRKGRDGVPYLTPLVKITFGPIFKTRARRPVFRFADATGQAGTQFYCRVDGAAWRGCGSPFRSKRLNPGRHTFKVRAVNAVGVSSPRAASRSFKLVPR